MNEKMSSTTKKKKPDNKSKSGSSKGKVNYAKGKNEGTKKGHKHTSSHHRALTKEEISERKDWYTIQKIKLPWAIQIMANANLAWEVGLYITVVLGFFCFTYGCFFTYFNESVWNIAYATNILYAVDVIMRLGVEIWRCLYKSEVLVYTLPYKFFHCLVDLISLFPLFSSLALAKDIDSFDSLSFTDYYRTNAILRLYRGWLFIHVLKVRRLISEEGLFLLGFTNFYLLFINSVACIFIFLTRLQPTDFLLWRNLDAIDKSWAKNFRQKKPGYGQDPIDLFVLSTHFSTATVTTVGYGDLHGQTEEEMIACIVIMLIGAIFLNGYFTSQITNFQLELDGARYDLFFRLEGITSHLKQIGMSKFFQSKVELYYNCLWTYREGVDRVLFIDHIPRSVQEDVYYDICLEMFHKSYLFRDLDEAFLRAVSKIVKISLYNPEMILCRYGGYANQMYYILQGECQAMSKHDTSKRAAVLRAGSIIGETNLFFSCPYTISVETNTCCQFIIIDKEDLMSCFTKFPTELVILRSRTQTKVNQMYRKFKVLGEDPICWVQIREEKDVKAYKKKKNAKAKSKSQQHDVYIKNDPENDDTSVNIMARWGEGFNLVVKEDVVADADRFVIFESQCRNKMYKKNHVTPYMTCVVPEILNSQIPWIVVWNYVILVFSLIYAFIGPYCYAFGASSQLQYFICVASIAFQYVNDLMYIFDVIVEIIGACPVEGLYFKFQDGLKVKTRQMLFYFDILGAIPLGWISSDQHDYYHAFNVSLKSIKLWKVIRYLRYLDNIYPKRLFWFRLGQTFVVLMYGIHFIACIMFYLACPTHDVKVEKMVKDGESQSSTSEEEFRCTNRGWLASYQTAANLRKVPVQEEQTPGSLAERSPYLLSFYFSAATLTSAGFGDFSPQNILEMLFTILFQLIGFFIIGYYTSLLTSALACVVKPKLEFQQKLLSVRRFMHHYVLPEALQRRIVEHYELQHQFHYGINLPEEARHYLFDSPDYIKSDVLYTDVVLLLDGVPLFSKTDSKTIIKTSENIKRYLIPPNVTFLHVGEVRRSLYCIKFGSIGVFDSRYESPTAILETTCYFGLRDLLFGEPSHFNYVTLSYCVIYEVTQTNVMNVFEDDEELNDHLSTLRDETKEEVELMCRTYARMRRGVKKDRAMEVPSWIIYKADSASKSTRQKYKEYRDYFEQFKFGKILRMFLMNGVIHPAGIFAAWWTCWMSLVSCTILCMLVIETFMYYRPPIFRIIQYILDVFLFMDVYVKFHWAYYLPDGLLVAHPLKTAGTYVFEGTFIYDVLMLAHPELIPFAFGYTTFLGYGPSSSWYTKLRWVRLIQVKRIPQLFKIIHAIFSYRNLILFVLYVSMTLVVCTIVAAIALAIGCPWGANDWNEGDEYKLPFCQQDTWALTKGNVMANFTDRWIVGIYYVCQVILVIGFGDMVTLEISEVYLLIFMSVFGFIFMRCVVADITAAEVDSDEVRSNYIDQMKTLRMIMKREKVNERIIQNVHEQLEHNWKQSKGLKPRELFSDLHAALETDLYQAFVGERLSKIPLFEGLPPNVLRNICKFVKKYYFLVGERVTRFGNLEYHLYIIVSGKVWVTDRFLNYGCTLHKNETFGESSVIGKIPGRFTVIAAENTEVFGINLADFEIILNRYPVVKEIFNIRTSKGHCDFFEHKIYDMIDYLKSLNGEERERRMNVLVARSQLAKHLVYAREDVEKSEEVGEDDVKTFKRKKRRKFVAFGTDDDGLPFIYFVSQRSRTTGKHTPCPPILHPNCGFLKLFLTLVSMICMFSPAVTVYELCFPPVDGPDDFSSAIKLFSEIMVFIMFAYIALNFFMAYKDTEGNYVKNLWCIIINYIFSPSGIWLDLIAAIPAMVCPGPDSDNPWRYLRLTRTIWLVRYYMFQFQSKDDLSISAFQFKIKISVSSFCLMAHILSCIFYSISNCRFTTLNTGEEEYVCGRKNNNSSHTNLAWTLSFVEQRGITDTLSSKDRDLVLPWRWWVRALYWVVTVISTTGFGDITPLTVPEMIVGIIAVFCGAFVLSIILSHFTAGMASLTKSHREYLYQVKLLIKYLKNIGLSSLRQELVQLYFEAVWSNLRGSLYHNAAKMLPPALQIEVLYALFEPVLTKVKFFKAQDSIFIRQVSARVEHSVYLPGVCIVKEGDQGDLMFIVYKGRVSGIADGHESDHELRDMYVVGDTFGKFPALFYDEWYKKSYRAEEYTEVLAISQADILNLTRVYENFWKVMVAYVDNKYDPDGPSECIFALPRKKKSGSIEKDDIADLLDYIKPKADDRNKGDARKNENKRKPKNHKKVSGESVSSFGSNKKKNSNDDAKSRIENDISIEDSDRGQGDITQSHVSKKAKNKQSLGETKHHKNRHDQNIGHRDHHHKKINKNEPQKSDKSIKHNQSSKKTNKKKQSGTTQGPADIDFGLNPIEELYEYVHENIKKGKKNKRRLSTKMTGKDTRTLKNTRGEAPKSTGFDINRFAHRKIKEPLTKPKIFQPTTTKQFTQTKTQVIIPPTKEKTFATKKTRQVAPISTKPKKVVQPIQTKEIQQSRSKSKQSKIIEQKKIHQHPTQPAITGQQSKLKPSQALKSNQISQAAKTERVYEKSTEIVEIIKKKKVTHVKPKSFPHKPKKAEAQEHITKSLQRAKNKPATQVKKPKSVVKLPKPKRAKTKQKTKKSKKNVPYQDPYENPSSYRKPGNRPYGVWIP